LPVTCAFASPPGTFADVGGDDNLPAPVDVITGKRGEEEQVRENSVRALRRRGFPPEKVAWR
jgi:hypothetical protein